MALKTNSKFYYGLKITSDNRYVDFNEGLLDLVATLSIGTYTGSQLCDEIKLQMDQAGVNTYTVTYDRTTRKFTISTTTNFSLLTLSGVNAGRSALSLLGFTTDKTGFSSYLSDVSTGKSYTTQFIIQSYKPTYLNRKSIEGVVNKSSSGVVEVVKFGNESFMSCELLFITNIIQHDGSIIKTNVTGVEDYISLIQWCTDKGVLEFMEDESNVNLFETFLLESTEQDPKGLDYELIENYDKGLAEYYRSGVLKFKLLEV